MLDIKGKVALVTGGASGIGLACAEELLKNGAQGVSIVDMNEQKGVAERSNLNQKYGRGKVLFVKANVANKTELEEAFKKTIEAFRHLDIVFNNAGLLQEIDYELCLDVNIKGAAHCLKLALDEYLPKYKSSQEAVIINTSSLGGLIPFDGGEMYSTTKFAVVALTRNFGVEFHYKRTGVRVIAICPDATDTPIMNDIVSGLFYKELEPLFIGNTQRAMQTPEQLAKVWLKLVESADNGSVWYIGAGKGDKVDFPDVLENLNVTV